MHICSHKLKDDLFLEQGKGLIFQFLKGKSKSTTERKNSHADDLANIVFVVPSDRKLIILLEFLSEKSITMETHIFNMEEDQDC